MTEQAEPKLGEWWMVKSTETKRMCPMMKTVSGWASIQNAEGKRISNIREARRNVEYLDRIISGELPMVISESGYVRL